MADPDPHQVAQLKAALEHFQPGTLFDREEEQTLAPVRTRALRLLDQRARSKSELRSRLISAEFDPELVERVLDSLENSGLVNDAVFASEWVRQRSQRRGKSARALDMELLDKGVAEPVRQEALSQITAEDEEAAARAVAEKKAREVKAAPSDRAEYDKHLRRIVGVMARRGYSSALSLRLGREVLDARIAECE
ncbi:recombination regulator RecX [Corynebacterium sanguinis]|uniref:Regulatory protein RecX n=1 Tax=Corynebacterium sanguinis TaxID=2594913 RepID=A0A6C1TXV9_9CORY|nr:recombination regulator RecX [Corynebacterium sanguinis]MBA4506017.1 recombination regulator RecX [Corynebacterium sanguinis]MCT1414764.1 recombination regulator RecX [Corynebacterium sanguinis]MCT1498298.1 recombination regulator RecX [Corynebacterium sanguinis]MCT1613888.1 recombination regulator RecX [Corynebacterium sanguinis]MCT1805641.1 recombination regulator RecX [Corynebacterium sanguinis]